MFRNIAGIFRNILKTAFRNTGLALDPQAASFMGKHTDTRGDLLAPMNGLAVTIVRNLRDWLLAVSDREGADRAVRAVRLSARHAQYMLTLKVAETWPVCTVCNGWVMLLVCMGKTRFGGIIWGEVVMMHAQKFPISMYFLSAPAYLPKGCTLKCCIL